MNVGSEASARRLGPQAVAVGRKRKGIEGRNGLSFPGKREKGPVQRLRRGERIIKAPKLRKGLKEKPRQTKGGEDSDIERAGGGGLREGHDTRWMARAPTTSTHRREGKRTEITS